MPSVALARNAMNTRFELVLHGANVVALRAAGEEALDEVDRLENQLSLFRPTSEIAHVNARAARESVRVTPELFGLLERAQRLTAETDGAFDVTIGPLVRCWGFMRGAGRRPTEAELAEARATVGMHLVHLSASDSTVRFERDGVMLDLGAIGKGYAVERAAEILREAGVTSAILHGGTSTVHAIGRPPDAKSWPIAVDAPPTDVSSPAFKQPAGSKPPAGGTPNQLATVSLCDEAMSVSAIWGKSFQADGKTFGHVLDPRTGQPVGENLLAVIVLPSATESDALSTALLTLGSTGHERMMGRRPSPRTLLAIASDGGGGVRVESHAIELLQEG